MRPGEAIANEADHLVLHLRRTLERSAATCSLGLTKMGSVGDEMAITARITVRGGWIDVGLTGETLTLAAVGSPLHFLVKPPTSIPARHKQSEEKARFRRLAVEAVLAKDPDAAPDDAETVWSWRAG